MVRNPTVQNIQTYRKTLGHRIRDVIEHLTRKADPFVKFLFPNFIAFHYFYIITFTLICSIMIYPVKNFAYIDILFLATGAATQGGLNTVDLNNLTLYQQVILYITAILTDPIFIHSGLAFVRFYWFERYFDGIRDWSKRDFEMRRTMTLRQRELTKNTTNDNNSRSHSQGPLNFLTRTFTHGDKDAGNFQVRLFRGEVVKRDEDNNDETNNDVENKKEDSNEESSSRPRPQLKDSDTSERFISRRKSRDINPADMYRSIAMLQDRHENADNAKGPALVIKSPAEREKDIQEAQRLQKEREEQQGQSIQFKVEPRPTKSAKPAAESSGLRMPFTQRKRPSFFKGSQHAKLIRDKLRRRSEGSFIPANKKEEDEEEEEEEEEEEGHDADMEGSSDDEDAIESFDDEQQSLSELNSGNGSYQQTLHSNAVSEPSLETQDIEEDDEELSSLPADMSYYGMHPGGQPRNRLKRTMTSNYLSYEPEVGRNSTFVNLSESQKVELGGVEYRSTKLLCLILSIYYIGFIIMAMIVFVAWIEPMHNYKEMIREHGISPTWWGFWTGMSCFTDLGLTLTPDSMMSFDKSVYVLTWMMWFIIVGNTGFPILLRFIIWVLFKISPDLSLRKDSLGFLLDHPRRCFTMLFPKAATWWLFLILIGLNVIDLILFIVLDLNAEVVKDLSAGYKVLDGLFQAVSTRTAGFTVLDLSQLHPSVQVSYMLMMYVSVMPLAISIRRTNVYEEQSLGVYGNAEQNENDGSEKSTRNFIGAHLRRQLSFDLWYMFLGLFIICICEGPEIQNANKPSFTIFQCLFEVVSAYGTVGLSLGYPGTSQSFSAQFTVISKLVIIAMLIRGRHRGLPYTLDRAIILPSAKLKENDLLHEITHSRKPTIGLTGSVSHDNRAESVGDMSSTFTNNRMNVLRSRSRSVWHGLTSAFSMGHQPKLNHALTTRTLDDTINTHYTPSGRSDESFSNRSLPFNDDRSYPMHKMEPDYHFIDRSSSPADSHVFKSSFNLGLSDFHANTVDAFEHSNSNSNSNTNSKNTETSSSAQVFTRVHSTSSLHSPHSTGSLKTLNTSPQ
ncbi:unnamed protein product [Kluyveromyces dobzhanskii CBS 2104]|uniref:Potassium transport protein n=1 Tax=Kluyveromyces dobzhanskii CBS 2104 TaxID=1427455 RepID=A0A0A8L9D8_9SACH|nr:unnamed protein product [Kluyveromyces dobzhanskii CBS 2104]